MFYESETLFSLIFIDTKIPQVGKLPNISFNHISHAKHRDTIYFTSPHNDKYFPITYTKYQNSDKSTVEFIGPYAPKRLKELAR